MVYRIVSVSAIHEHESAIGIHYVRSLLNLSPTSLPIPPLLVVTEHQVWTSCVHTANSHWLSILHVIMYMFLCYSFNLSLPLLPLLCLQVCSLCLCLHCLVNRFISTIFLDSIYICFSLSDLLYSVFIHLIRTDSNEFLFMAE